MFAVSLCPRVSVSYAGRTASRLATWCVVGWCRCCGCWFLVFLHSYCLTQPMLVALCVHVYINSPRQPSKSTARRMYGDAALPLSHCTTVAGGSLLCGVVIALPGLLLRKVWHQSRLDLAVLQHSTFCGGVTTNTVQYIAKQLPMLWPPALALSWAAAAATATAASTSVVAAVNTARPPALRATATSSTSASTTTTSATTATTSAVRAARQRLAQLLAGHISTTMCHGCR